MPDEQNDTGEITQRFRAFASRAEDEPGRGRGLTVLLACAVVIAAGVVVFLVAR